MNVASIRRVSYLLSLRAERNAETPPRWHGTLETAAGQRFEFSTLAELDRLLCELGGWMDPPLPADAKTATL